jgi:hypothetical protein
MKCSHWGCPREATRWNEVGAAAWLPVCARHWLRWFVSMGRALQRLP